MPRAKVQIPAFLYQWGDEEESMDHKMNLSEALASPQQEIVVDDDGQLLSEATNAIHSAPPPLHCSDTEMAVVKIFAYLESHSGGPDEIADLTTQQITKLIRELIPSTNVVGICPDDRRRFEASAVSNAEFKSRMVTANFISTIYSNMQMADLERARRKDQEKHRQLSNTATRTSVLPDVYIDKLRLALLNEKNYIVEIPSENNLRVSLLKVFACATMRNTDLFGFTRRAVLYTLRSIVPVHRRHQYTHLHSIARSTKYQQLPAEFFNKIADLAFACASLNTCNAALAVAIKSKLTAEVSATASKYFENMRRLYRVHSTDETLDEYYKKEGEMDRQYNRAAPLQSIRVAARRAPSSVGVSKPEPSTPSRSVTVHTTQNDQVNGAVNEGEADSSAAEQPNDDEEMFEEYAPAEAGSQDELVGALNEYFSEEGNDFK
ncbi:unnamed protein product [Caenorhabditis auriculariae]|uniref:Uncharacterized protein n=1 Tax=Caenorhabditis auriculariae TaxID=2777116 RepID=A0A8S1H8Y5_9PELO|nr:unnamed protein product [Caenorhabditis auriculariae]